MEQIQFDNKNKSAEVSLEQLRATMAIAEFDGNMPEQVPLVHHELIDQIIEKVQRVGINYSMKPIVIREKYCNKKKDSNNDPSNYLVKRLVGKIRFEDAMNDGQSDQMHPGVAFSYIYDGSQRNIEIAFGPSVDVCDNLTCFGQYRFSTNGGDRVEFSRGMQLLDRWMRDYHLIKADYGRRIEQLKAVKLLPDTLNMLIGELFTRAVRANNNEHIKAPLNQTQISAMVNKGFDKISNEDEAITGWDLLNWGTDVLKPHTSDMVELISCTSDFNDFIYEALVPKTEQDIPTENPTEDVDYTEREADQGRIGYTKRLDNSDPDVPEPKGLF